MRGAMQALVMLASDICLAPAFAATGRVPIDAGEFQSVLPLTEKNDAVVINAFYLDRVPVTNAEFLKFVIRNPEWQRGKAILLFADENFLAYWPGALEIAAEQSNRPAVNVSWFAAHAYCETQGGRLPSWHEWEYVAAADESQRDARDNPVWQQKILGWYSETGGKKLADVGRQPPNAWGVQDMHGLAWEWVEDFNALLVSSDNRVQDGADKQKFCGAGAATMEEKENYAVLMRVAMLSSLDGNATTRNTGFRCAYDSAGEMP